MIQPSATCWPGSWLNTARQHLLPRDVVQAHERGDIHYHDLDYSPFFPMFNWMSIDLKGMLTQGFKMGNAEIQPPKSILRQPR
ncbi:anaerobic ribonucleoside-triphosphate reductase [Shigella flexneri]